jgi:hypothetical protein
MFIVINFFSKDEIMEIVKEVLTDKAYLIDIWGTNIEYRILINNF